MTFTALIFFIAFAGIVLGMYLAIRRRLLPAAWVAVGGILGGIIAMTLFALAQGTIFAHALLVGVLIGGAFSTAALVIAWYFQGNEMRQAYRQQQDDVASQQQT